MDFLAACAACAGAGANAAMMRNRRSYATFAASTALVAGVALYKVRTTIPSPPPSGPVSEGMTRICVAGYPASPPTEHSHLLADKIAKEYPKQYETWYYWDLWSLWTFLPQRFATVTFPEHLKGHETSPFVWFERGSKNEVEPIGGDDNFTKWAKKEFPDNKVIQDYCSSKVPGYPYPGMYHANKAPATCKS